MSGRINRTYFGLTVLTGLMLAVGCGGCTPRSSSQSSGSTDAAGSTSTPQSLWYASNTSTSDLSDWPNTTAAPSLARPRALSLLERAGDQLQADSLESKLQQRDDFQFVHASLPEVVKTLRQRLDSNVLTVPDRLNSVSPCVNVTIDLCGVPRDVALDLILERFGLTWAVRSNVLFIGTEKAVGDPILKVYDVSKLVVPSKTDDGQLDSLVEAITANIAWKSWSDHSSDERKAEADSDLRATFALGSWTGNSHTRSGTIRPAQVGGVPVLVISQSYQVHREVEQLLDELCLVVLSRPSK